MTDDPNRKLLKPKSLAVATRSAWLLAKSDIRALYRRTALGPFWIVIGTGFQVAVIGLVFGNLFGADLPSYLPNLAFGLVLWNFIAPTITEMANSFVANRNLLTQTQVAPITFPLKAFVKQLIYLAHNVVIAVLAAAIFSRFDINVVLLLITTVFTLIMAFSLGLLFSMASAYWGDFQQILAVAINSLFFITPVIWVPELLNDRVPNFFFQLNPLFLMLHPLRASILGESSQLGIQSAPYLVAASLLLFVMAGLIWSRTSKKVVFWV